MEQNTRLSSDISSKILSIGPDYQNHRGGVGAVIDVYSKYYEVYNFIPSYKVGSTLFKCYIFFLCLIKLVYILISNQKIKIIHIHGASYGSFYRKYIIFLIGKYIFRKKIIYHIHGGGFQIFYKNSNILIKRLIKNMLAKADTIICLSKSWYEYYWKNFNIKKLVILPNMIDYPKELQKSTNSTTITFLFLGLICDDKGIFDLINVIANNKVKYRTIVKLWIAGNGETHRLQNLIKEQQIEDIIEFLGWLNNNEKNIVLNNSNVYILPSYNEGLPISILEAMSYGKAVISTNVGGIPELVINKENGLLIMPGNLQEIEQALNYFIENPELIEEYGATSKTMVQKYLPHSVIKELENHYKTVYSYE